ncbi:MAG: GspE/PulE family protein [Candidatus Pacebacteria bacterium]|jgi:type IV pilus assembly protein PilB|nr:GspE/PulE family protein [Candidatus Paceibacterota bacterium]|tara:strand:+ start:149 stop:1810 length:1662 start_codon:yes stop_codon:yes gene_type:complete
MALFADKKTERKIKLLREREEEDLAKLLSKKYGVEYGDLSRVSIDTDALKLIPEGVAKENKVAVFSKLEKNVNVAAHSPKDDGVTNVLEELKKKGFAPKIFMVSNKSLEKAWTMYKDISFSEKTKAGVLEISSEQIENLVKKIKTLDEVIKIIKETLVMKKGHKTSRIIETVLAGALAMETSDVHIEPEESNARLRFRLNGMLTEILYFDTKTYNLLLSRIKILAGLKLNVKKEAQDGRFSINLGETDVEIRASSMPGAYGEAIVLRILNPETIKVSMEALGMDEDLLKAIMGELQKPNGIILNTGPTGSGKTTTLYAFLSKIHQPEIKIITIEDPIEYHLPGVVQTQVDRKKKYTFSTGLRSSLRQDPDIIMVGEIRDNETAKIAIHAALTGHLVLSTLHTNSAAGTFPRLIDLGVDEKVIGPAVNVSMAQRLVRKLGEKRKEIPIKGKDKEDIERILAGVVDKSKIPQTNHLWVPDVPENSSDTGYSGRTGIFEAILIDDEMEQLISKKPRETEVEELAKKQGILTMKEDAVIKALKGITSLEEVRRVIEL